MPVHIYVPGWCLCNILVFAGGPLNQHPVTMDIAHQNGQNVQTHAPASRVCSAAMTVARWPTSQAKAQAMDDILGGGTETSKIPKHVPAEHKRGPWLF